MSRGVQLGFGALCLLLAAAPPVVWVKGAEARLVEAESSQDAAPQAAIAAAAEEGYCSGQLKRVLSRVLQSCGLTGAGGTRGCQPLEARKVAALAGDDFNALFLPLQERAGLLQFDQDSAELDADDLALLDRVFSDQRGASYFFVVSRASPEGSEVYNRDLSQRRGESVLAHLKSNFNDPDLDKEVGLLWLGEQVAQLDQRFCGWTRSGAADQCTDKDLNRSTFIAWIDCRL